MASGGIQGQLLEINVVGCTRLRDTEWISRQDPYVCLEYANSKFRTKTCTDGGKNPTFNEKFVLPLIEGLREVNVSVWNSNTLQFDDLIGTGRILLQRVLSSGYDDSTWPLSTRSGKNAGDVRIILHYASGGKTKVQSASAAPPYTGQMPTTAPYGSSSGYPQFQQPSSLYPGYPPPVATYKPESTAYPAFSTYKSEPTAYPPPQSTAYPLPPSNVYPPPENNVYPPPPSNVYPPPENNVYPPPPSNVYPPPSASYPPAPAAYPPYPSMAYPPPGPPTGYPAQPYPGYYPGTYPTA
uniref:TSA: Wollemia nobilis Ref_Wollemi_Transcript_10715_1422 transcribed RNA sequence n=1 Tax=Wollemia nobilis TaxID=56998 RepID=A0A0C9S6Q4_9CONI